MWKCANFIRWEMAKIDYLPIVTAAGWSLTGKCRCSGVLKEKYAKASKNKLIIYPDRGTFLLKYFGQPVVRGQLINIAASLN